MTRDEIKTKVIEIVRKELHPPSNMEIEEMTSFVNDLKADSLDSVEMIMEFEDVFGLVISDNEAEKLKTVGMVVDYLNDKVGDK